MTPTVGRIVHFGSASTPVEPLAAIVTKVHSDDTVDLSVFKPGQSGAEAYTSVSRSDALDAFRWSWPVVVAADPGPLARTTTPEGEADPFTDEDDDDLDPGEPVGRNSPSMIASMLPDGERGVVARRIYAEHSGNVPAWESLSATERANWIDIAVKRGLVK